MGEKEIIIVFKKNNAPARELSAVIVEWLKRRHIACVEVEANSGMLDVSTNPELVIVLGGDGTILGVGRKTACKNIPIFGINFGRVGFLTTATQDNWRQKLLAVLEGKAHVRNCAALEWKHIRDGQEMDAGLVINDIVLGHGSLARLISMELAIDGHKMGILRCDGLIASTPLGSSAYNFSAGGPVLYAEMDAICLTPICPFQKGIAPLVLPARTEIEIRIVQGTPESYLTLDGQICVKVNENDMIITRGLPNALKLMGTRELFFERLHSRGFQLACSDDSE